MVSADNTMSNGWRNALVRRNTKSKPNRIASICFAEFGARKEMQQLKFNQPVDVQFDYSSSHSQIYAVSTDVDDWIVVKLTCFKYTTQMRNFKIIGNCCSDTASLLPCNSWLIYRYGHQLLSGKSSQQICFMTCISFCSWTTRWSTDAINISHATQAQVDWLRFRGSFLFWS